jgi:hypothetical protein
MRTYPGKHNPTHPNRGRKLLQHQRRERLEEQIGVTFAHTLIPYFPTQASSKSVENVLENAQHPRPLLTIQIAQLLLDTSALLKVDNGRVGDVGHVDAHDKVDEGIPEEQALVEFAVRALERDAAALQRCLDISIV